LARDHHSLTCGVVVTVVPYTAEPSVTYKPFPPVGAPAVSIGIPRELKMTQALLAITPPASSVHSGENPIVACVFGGGAVSEPNPNETPRDVRVATVSATQLFVPLFQVSRT
jgi:hypothetical protein